MATLFRSPLFVRIFGRRPKEPDWPVNLLTLGAPNPSRPFSQADWPSLARRRPPQASDAPTSMRALLTPNPAQPFNEEEWRSPARPRPPKFAESPAGLRTLLEPNPARPFQTPDWLAAVRLRGARVDDPPNLVPLYNPPVVAAPFTPADWPNPQRGRPAQVSDSPGTLGTLLAPNPAQPFTGPDWVAAQRIRGAIVNDPPNLLPLQNPPVVGGDPFFATEWPLATRALAPQKSDATLKLRPLYAPNPDRPFSQSDWIAAQRAGVARVDDPPNLIPLYNPPAIAGDPFIAPDWVAATRPRQALVDDVVNLYPLYFPPVVGDPFSQVDWLNPVRRLLAATETIFVPPLEPVTPPIPGPTIDHQGDGKKRRKRRDKTRELFDEIERSLRDIVYGPVVEIGTAKAAIERTEPRIRAALERMSNIAVGHADLTARAAEVRRDMIEWRRQRELEDDEETWMFLD